MFKFLEKQSMDGGQSAGVERRLQLSTERLGELNPADLASVVGATSPPKPCPCATDVSNSCCGPNGSC